MNYHEFERFLAGIEEDVDFEALCRRAIVRFDVLPGDLAKAIRTLMRLNKLGQDPVQVLSWYLDNNPDIRARALTGVAREVTHEQPANTRQASDAAR
jgi:hypothetical protein